MCVGVKDMLFLVIGNGDVEVFFGVDWSYWCDIDCFCDYYVVFIIGWCYMYDVGVIVGCYKVVC